MECPIAFADALGNIRCPPQALFCLASVEQDSRAHSIQNWRPNSADFGSVSISRSTDRSRSFVFNRSLWAPHSASAVRQSGGLPDSKSAQQERMLHKISSQPSPLGCTRRASPTLAVRSGGQLKCCSVLAPNTLSGAHASAGVHCNYPHQSRRIPHDCSENRPPALTRCDDAPGATRHKAPHRR
jgi:hypothetical protein